MGKLCETARPGNRGDQLVPLCNSRDQFLSRKKQPYRQLGSGVYPRSAMIGNPTLASTLPGSCASGSHPHAAPQPAWVRQMAKHSARAGRRAQCPRSHIGVTSLTIKNTRPLLSPEGDSKKRLRTGCFGLWFA